MDYQKFFTNYKTRLALATISCLLWGSAYPSVKLGYQLFAIGPDDTSSKLLFAGLRFFLAGVLVLFISVLLKRNLRLPDWRAARQVAVLGLINTAIQYSFFYIGLSYTSGTNGSILNSTQTFFSILLVHFIYHNEKLTRNRILGVLLGFFGVVISLVQRGFQFEFTFKGDGFVIISALLLAISAIYIKKLTATLDVMALTGYHLAFGGLLLIIFGGLTGGQLGQISASGIGLLIYLTFLSATAFTLWSTLLRYNKVGKVVIYNFLIPVFGTLLSGLLLHESILRLNYLFALLSISLGIWLVNKLEPDERSL